MARGSPQPAITSNGQLIVPRAIIHMIPPSARC